MKSMLKSSRSLPVALPPSPCPAPQGLTPQRSNSLRRLNSGCVPATSQHFTDARGDCAVGCITPIPACTATLLFYAIRNAITLAASRLARKPKGWIARARPYAHIVAFALLFLCAFGALYFEARVDSSAVRSPRVALLCSVHAVHPKDTALGPCCSGCMRRPEQLTTSENALAFNMGPAARQHLCWTFTPGRWSCEASGLSGWEPCCAGAAGGSDGRFGATEVAYVEAVASH